METHIGIVLKTCYSRVPDMTVLDRALGKIKGRVNMRNKSIRASYGSIITYMLTQRGSSYIFDVVDLEQVPFSFARQDIFFLHHILELCYYFLPEGCAVDDIFEFLVHLFQLESNEKLRLRKHLVLARLFSLFGVYPEHVKISQFIERVIHQSLDELLSTPVDAKMNAWLGQWIWSCIVAHPYKEQFKTIWSLQRAELHES